MKKPIPFGKYYLLERINVGGMAEVFRAKAYGVEGFERLVAVKRILPNIAEDQEFITMFKDEAKIAVQLNHANIAQIHDLGMVDNAYYIALEHVHGRDLRSIFERCRGKGDPMPIAQACFVVMKMCEGLDYAHNKRDTQGRDMNLVHRDVSPQNVLVSFEGEVKLIDFGIAKAAGKVGKTQAGILKGKFGYMSPEQVRGLPIDRRSDIFSNGIVLYEMLTGERLFVGESDFSTLEKVRNVEILPPSTYNRKIPDELERIVLKALAKDPDDRYSNSIDLHDELQAFVYTAGEFYSRKDLAAWMKKTFAKEIEEETAKLEQFRQLAPPEGLASAPRTTPPTRQPTANVRRTTQGMASAVPPPPPPPLPATTPGNGRAARTTGPQAPAAPQGVPVHASIGPAAKTVPLQATSAQPITIGDKTEEKDLEWDEDELETQIYDEPPGGGKRAPAAAAPVPAPASLPMAAAAVPTMAMPAPPALVVTSMANPPGGAPTSGPAAPTLMHAPTAKAKGRPSESFDSLGPLPKAANGSGPAANPSPSIGRPLMSAAASFGSGVLGSRGTVVPEVKVRKPPSARRMWIYAGAGAVGVAALIVGGVTLIGGGKSAEDTKKVAGAAAKADEKPAEPAPPPVDPSSGFDLTVDPAGSKVSLDGREIGNAPLRVRSLMAGKHKLDVAGPAGTKPYSQEIAIDQGKALNLSVKLESIAPPQATVKLTSDPPGARVTLLVDGTKVVVGTTPIDAKVDASKHYEALFELAHYGSLTKPLSVGAGSDGELNAVLLRDKEPAPPRPAPAVVAKAAPPPPAPPPPKETKPATATVVPKETAPAPKETKPVAATPKETKPAPQVMKEPAAPHHEAAQLAPKETAPPPTPREASPAPRETAPDTSVTTAATGKLAIGAKPQCSIFIDGKDTGRTTPVRDLDVKTGSVTVTLVNNEFGIREKFTVQVKSGEVTKVIKDFSDRIPQ